MHFETELLTDLQRIKRLLTGSYKRMMSQDILKSSEESVQKLAELLKKYGLLIEAGNLEKHLLIRDYLLTIEHVQKIFVGPAAGKQIVFLGREALSFNSGDLVMVSVGEYIFPAGDYYQGQILSKVPREAQLIDKFFDAAVVKEEHEKIKDSAQAA